MVVRQYGRSYWAAYAKGGKFLASGRTKREAATNAASAMSAGTAETAEQAQGEARQRGGEAETPKGPRQ